ncbi:alpha/beta hydrolase family protein [Frateuria defendens]|uniref:alpha/beta hydrolase family protein n=1 Tax=Frateuria defendens TaxID=2219559 RepID=UPI00066FFB7B|nr:alpha/beta fold hydrolase [Frateuria defendens]
MKPAICFRPRHWLLAALLAAGTAQAADPLVTDPPRGTFPPGQAELAIPSHGARMNGFLYTAAGPGPHPLAIFLHGYPGNERNLDLAQAARRAGWNALYFDYRGSWGSGGTFSFGNALEDVAAALAFVRDPANAAKYRIDPRRIALVGHSMGGGLTLLATARDPGVTCAATLAAWNFGGAPARWKAEPAEGKEMADYFRATTDPDAGPLRAKAGDLEAELAAHGAEWDVVAHAADLKDRHLLVIADTGTPMDIATYQAFTAALHQAGASHLQALTYDDDHPFSAHRVALAKGLVKWLGSECSP